MPYLARFESVREPASVNRTPTTSVGRPPAITRSIFAAASLARTMSASMSTEKPCTIMTRSVQPSRDAASNSSARRRVAGGLRLRLCVGIGREHRTKARGRLPAWQRGAILERRARSRSNRLSHAAPSLPPKIALPFQSSRRPASVIRTRVTSIDRPPATIRSIRAVASPARTSATTCLTSKPCAARTASLQPAGQEASNSSARRRVAGGLRLRLCVGIGREHRATCFMAQASLTQKKKTPLKREASSRLGVCPDRGGLNAVQPAFHDWRYGKPRPCVCDGHHKMCDSEEVAAPRRVAEHDEARQLRRPCGSSGECVSSDYS